MVSLLNVVAIIVIFFDIAEGSKVRERDNKGMQKVERKRER